MSLPLEEKMKYKYMSSEKIEKKRRRSTKTSGVFSILIGSIFVLGGLFFGVMLKSLGGLLVMLVFALIFIGAGIYFFNQIKLEEKRSKALDDPNSRVYKKRQAILQKKRERYLNRAENHGSLKKSLCLRATVIWGTFTLISVVGAFFSLAIGVIAFGLLITAVLCFIAFIRSIFGSDYKIILSGYSEHGMDRTDAENDFASSRAYLILTEVISVSSKIFVATESRVVLAMGDIVWVYAGYENIDMYKSGMYSHTERKYCIVIGLQNGMQIKVSCPEELCSVLVNDIVSSGVSVASGYSPELQELFINEPENFRNSFKSGVDVITEPVALKIELKTV